MKIQVLLFFILATTAAATDWCKHRIPNGCCVAIIFAAVWNWGSENGILLPEYLLGGLIISVPMFLLALCCKGSFGGGDIKFVAACGLFLGWEVMLTSMVYAVLAAGVYAAVLLCRRYDKRTKFPLGVFLVSGMAVAVFCN